jgi:hypothetical protein
MKRLRRRPPRQLILNLEREVRAPPVFQESELLLQTLADLLLGALGHDIEETASEIGGTNESEDHS